MNLLFFFILRKIFVRLEFSDKEISLEKGLILKRAAVMPISAAVKVTSKRTLIMRVFGAKEISVFSLCGKIKFYLPKNERLPFLPEFPSDVIKPRFRDIAFGAFIDTRALGGLFVFVAVLRKISSIFGSEYSERVIAALQKTADDLENALTFFRVTVPKAAVVLAVFALSAWGFAYIIKLLRLKNLRVSADGSFVFVSSGIITLYEHTLVPNSPAVCCDTITTIIARRMPLYLRGVMIHPCVRRGDMGDMVEMLCGLTIPSEKLTSPRRAFFGHIAAPLAWAGAFAAALFAIYYIAGIVGLSIMTVKTVLYSGIIVSLYAAGVFALYMPRSGISHNTEFTAVTARRGLRLYTAVFRNDMIKRSTIAQNVFQKRTDVCNLRVGIAERRKFTVRQLPKNDKKYPSTTL